jgi:hypothetical protein
MLLVYSLHTCMEITLITASDFSFSFCRDFMHIVLVHYLEVKVNPSPVASVFSYMFILFFARSDLILQILSSRMFITLLLWIIGSCLMSVMVYIVYYFALFSCRNSCLCQHIVVNVVFRHVSRKQMQVRLGASFVMVYACIG